VSHAESIESIGLLALRCVVGIVLVAHGYNHIFGGGKIAGTASWFAGLGMRPGWLHAWTASITELGAGVLLILGLLTPLASAGVIGTMTVALVTNHLRNGFFIFRPGEGYEYVLTLIVVGFALGCVGPGHYSIDHAVGIFDPPDVLGLLIAVIAGFGGAGLLLVTSWRPGAIARADAK
jgi:putative oxidoreductase